MQKLASVIFLANLRLHALVFPDDQQDIGGEPMDPGIGGYEEPAGSSIEVRITPRDSEPAVVS